MNDSRPSNELVILLRDRDEDSPDMLLRSAADEIERLQRDIVAIEKHDDANADELARLRLSNEPPAAHSSDHLSRFSEWLAKEMPAGTVIGEPQWWARKLLVAACVFADELPAQPPRITSEILDRYRGVSITLLEAVGNQPYRWTEPAVAFARLWTGTTKFPSFETSEVQP